MEIIKKLYGGIDLTWKRLIIAAVAIGHFVKRGDAISGVILIGNDGHACYPFFRLRIFCDRSFPGSSCVSDTVCGIHSSFDTRHS